MQRQSGRVRGENRRQEILETNQDIAKFGSLTTDVSPNSDQFKSAPQSAADLLFR